VYIASTVAQRRIVRRIILAWGENEDPFYSFPSGASAKIILSALIAASGFICSSYLGATYLLAPSPKSSGREILETFYFSSCILINKW
jgi:hypothetical protein